MIVVTIARLYDNRFPKGPINMEGHSSYEIPTDIQQPQYQVPIYFCLLLLQCPPCNFVIGNICTYLWTQSYYESIHGSGTLWPDLAKFRHFYINVNRVLLFLTCLLNIWQNFEYTLKFLVSVSDKVSLLWLANYGANNLTTWSGM